MFRTVARAGQDKDLWPVVLLLFAVLVPAVCLLWFMSAAMGNERLAARQKLADVYRGQLSSFQARLERQWKDTAAELQKLARTAPASAAFARCVQSGHVDSVIIFDDQGKILYPNAASAPPVVVSDGEKEIARGNSASELQWAEANRLEYLRKDFAAAASLYEGLARKATNVNLAARALQAQARCLVQAGQKAAAIRLVEVSLGAERYRHAVDAQGRLIAANAELMVLELLTNRASAAFESAALRLKERLLDYENPALAAPQRCFLMKELQKLSAQIELPTLSAEELAAEFALYRMPSSYPSPPLLQKISEGRLRPVPTGSDEPAAGVDSVLRPTPLPGVWQFTTPDDRVLALVRSQRLLARLQTMIPPHALPPDTEVRLLPPDTNDNSAFVTLPAGAQLPGWRLALQLKDAKLFDTAIQYRTAVYLWTGLLVVAAMGMLSLLAIRLVRRQAALARLKNDLAATVSHELKTPLSSMRVLVDTLLDAERLDEPVVREYLQLIARENERLSRLILNFLTFSRMERKRYAFHFAPLPARQIIAAAVDAVRERFTAPGCQFEVRVDGDLPNVVADPDALAAALVNLLDNAHKYSGESKHIILRARVEDGNVVFSVEDNGIGIPPRETKKIFSPFYQVDRRLSREGSGCGLGLSIVHSVTTAHRGSVSVASRPGHGSTFTICLPAAPARAQL